MRQPGSLLPGGQRFAIKMLDEKAKGADCGGMVTIVGRRSAGSTAASGRRGCVCGVRGRWAAESGSRIGSDGWAVYTTAQAFASSRSICGSMGRDTAQKKGEETSGRAQISLLRFLLGVSVPGTGGVMADWDGIPARERRQMEEILQLDMEELNVEVVDEEEEEEELERGEDDDDSVDAFLR